MFKSSFVTHQNEHPKIKCNQFQKKNTVRTQHSKIQIVRLIVVIVPGPPRNLTINPGSALLA